MTNQSLPRRFMMATTFAAMALGFAAKASAADAVTMFKVISPRDEIFVGVPAADLAAMGQGAPAEAIARKVAADGQLSLWQYSVQRGANGALVIALRFREPGDQSQIGVPQVDDAVFAQVEAGQHPVQAFYWQRHGDDSVEASFRIADRAREDHHPVPAQPAFERL